ncbi:hypothetical protein [Thermosynechococcus sp. FA-CM-4201]
MVTAIAQAIISFRDLETKLGLNKSTSPHRIYVWKPGTLVRGGKTKTTLAGARVDTILSMEQTLTVVCKLQPTAEQSLKIERFLKAFADACNFTNKTVQPTVTNKITIQNRVYQELRSRFGLSANQAVRLCARVGANRKTAKLKGKAVQEFKPTSADYDARIFTFKEKDESVSLTLLEGRETIQLDMGDYQKNRLRG